MLNQKRITFVATQFTDPWSGAEELWSRTAIELMSRGYSVSACVTAYSPPHPRVQELKDRGVDLWQHPLWYSLRKHPWRWIRARHKGSVVFEVERLLDARDAAFVVLNESPLPSVGLLELCTAKRLPFVTISNANKEAVWYPDEEARRYRAALAAARRCYFVSDANLRLSEKQIAGDLNNAEVIRCPVNVPFNVSLPWPPLYAGGEWRFACVGRLYPPAKGQDLLFEALAGPLWRGRSWKLYLYGAGEMRHGLERLAEKFGIADRVVLAGFKRVKEIWAANHVLVMPSRFEGLPLAMIEAMLCARPVVATDVAGHREVIEDGVTGFLAEATTSASVSDALERFWQRRDEAENMGKAGARRIRQLVPSDPVRVFSDKLQELIEASAAR